MLFILRIVEILYNPDEQPLEVLNHFNLILCRTQRNGIPQFHDR